MTIGSPGSLTVDEPGVVAIPLEANRHHRVGSIRHSIPDPSAERGETIECRDRSSAARFDVVIEPVTILDRDEHRQRSMVAFDDKSLAGRGLIEEGAERFAKVEGGNDSHGWP